MPTSFIFIKRHKRTLLSLSFILAYSITIAYATPPLTPYNSGETLDPSCIPGSANCFVSINNTNSILQDGNSFGVLTTIGTNDSQDLVLETNGLERVRVLGNGNVGVGTSTPLSLFSVGSSSQFQVNSSGSIATATGISSSGPITLSSLTTGRIPYAGTGGLIQDTSNLSWNNGTGTLGVTGTTSGSSLSVSRVPTSSTNSTAISALAQANANTFSGELIGVDAQAATVGVTGPGTYTGTTLYGVKSKVNAYWGAVPTAYGLYTQANPNFQGFGTYAGLFLAPQSSAGSITNNYGIYQADTAARNYFAGSLTLAANPTTSASTYDLLTRNTTTGAVEKILSSSLPLGTGTTNYLARWTGANTLGIGSIQDDGTNVGIGGAANVGYKLDVNGDINFTTGSSLISNNSYFSQADGSAGRWKIGNGTNGDTAIRFVSNGAGIASIDSVTWGNSGIQRDLSINPNGGNIGIGTLTPAYKLDVNGIGNFTDPTNPNGIVRINPGLSLAPRPSIYFADNQNAQSIKMGTTTGFQAIETDGNFYVSGNLSSGQALTTTGGFLSTDSIPTSLVPPVGSISLGSNNGGVGNPAFINLSRRGAFNAASFGTDLAGDFIFYRNPSSTISFDGTEVYKIVRSTGNFLLGTNVDSGYKLDVTDSTGKVVGINQTGVTNSPAMTIDYSGAGGGNLFSQSIFRVTSNSTNRNFASFGDVAVIDSSGRLFLNTPASGNFLDVGGSARVLNDLTVTDGITSLSNSGASNLLNLTFNGGTNAAAINISQTNAGGIGGYPFSLFRMDNRGSNDSVYIHNNGTNPFVIRNTGNVGIGTSTPAYKLDVNGNARISGGITTSEYMSTLANESISIGGIGGGLLTPGSQNVGIGGVTGPSSGTSNDNFFGGYRAGFYNGSGNHVGNVVIGSVAAYIQNGTLTNNVIIGRQSAGQGNLAADYVNTIILGAYASKQTTGGTLNNTTIIGTSLTTDLDNIVALGRSDQNILIGQTTTDLGYKLQVGSSSVSGIVASFTNSSGSCTINPTAGIACSSDQRLKKNIAVLEDNYLSKIMSLKPVKYNWNNETDTDGLHNGFIAQDLEQVFPDLVATDSNGMKSVFYTNLIPYTIKAIQEMNIQMIGLSNLEKPNGLRDSLIGWLGNAGNHITRIFTGEICLTDSSGSSECINKTELRQLKQLLQNPTPPVSNPDPEIVPPPTE